MIQKILKRFNQLYKGKAEQWMYDTIALEFGMEVREVENIVLLFRYQLEPDELEIDCQ